MTAIRPDRSHCSKPSHRRRWPTRRLGVLVAIAALGLAGTSSARPVSHHHPHRPNAFQQRNLVSDIAGVARITDRNLVNSWGLAAGPATPLWVADNGADKATVYRGAVRGSIPTIVSSLVVGIPGGAPTGAVFNPTNGFVIHAGTASAPARFIFDSEAGRIAAWSPNVPPTSPAQSVVTTPGAVYKGLALATARTGTLLYAANFHAARIDVFDARFAPVNLPGAFTDSALPAGFAPFNIQALGGRLYVTYAKQDAAAMDDVAGPGLGFVDVYDTHGHLLKRLVSGGRLNAPWGLVIAPRHFGPFGRELLVGNFGDGMINAFDPHTGRFQGQLRNEDGNPIQIDGLWALRFGNGVFGTPEELIFSAGIGDEQHGLLGEIVAHGGR